MNSPEVSVCIRAFTRPYGLRIAIASAIAQVYDDYEIVVSDDSGELEGTVAGVDDPRIRYLANPAPDGPARNLRHAVANARGRFVAILNEDDRWHPEFLAEIIAAFERHSDAGVVFTGGAWEFPGGIRPFRMGYAPGCYEKFGGEVVGRGVPASGVVFRRSVWEEVQESAPLRDGMVADTHLLAQAAARGWSFVVIDRPLVVMGLNRDQLSWSRDLASRMAVTLEAVRFADAASEEARLRALASAYLEAARVCVSRGQYGLARQHWRLARTTGLGRLGWREFRALTGLRSGVMRWGLDHPRALRRLLDLWGRSHRGSWLAPVRDFNG
jgi:glycosyltransferase involved in cell wall biosynthesis